ncbi:hypothetical protein D2T31_07215 [Sinirhodobacter populi]|uniref:Terminase large subunit GpA endonuclease domain-containing protein n=1 Tax=Paenirhodobacter populi TaxID=2306993 RepID=A0A443KD99_9RHOB|nr:hypothetical protein D2T31_07215 [Sinirhodobacter populi]
MSRSLGSEGGGHVTERDPDEGHVWAELDRIRREPIPIGDGRTLHIQACCIDTGGRNIDAVCSYAAARSRERVWAIEGGSEVGGRRQPIWPIVAPTTMRAGAKIFIVGTLAGKTGWRQHWKNAARSGFHVCPR